MNEESKSLIRIIRYAPFFIIIFTCILIIGLLYHEEEKEFQKEKNFTEKEYIKNETKALYANINTVHSYIKHEIKMTEDVLKQDITRRKSSLIYILKIKTFILKM